MTTISEAEYKRFVLEHPDEKWELHCGKLREKPAMTWDHNLTSRALRVQLERQLDPNEYEVIIDQGRVRQSGQGYYIPDLYVVPREMRRRLYQRGELELYPEPLPLVVEVWSPSTGTYDVETKLPQYQQRGDAEIWRIHPYKYVLTAWRRQPDGSYIESVPTTGTIQPIALPNVTIDIQALFEWR